MGVQHAGPSTEHKHTEGKNLVICPDALKHFLRSAIAVQDVLRSSNAACCNNTGQTPCYRPFADGVPHETPASKTRFMGVRYGVFTLGTAPDGILLHPDTGLLVPDPRLRRPIPTLRSWPSRSSRSALNTTASGNDSARSATPWV